MNYTIRINRINSDATIKIVAHRGCERGGMSLVEMTKRLQSLPTIYLEHISEKEIKEFQHFFKALHVEYELIAEKNSTDSTTKTPLSSTENRSPFMLHENNEYQNRNSSSIPIKKTIHSPNNRTVKNNTGFAPQMYPHKQSQNKKQNFSYRTLFISISFIILIILVLLYFSGNTRSVASGKISFSNRSMNSSKTTQRQEINCRSSIQSNGGAAVENYQFDSAVGEGSLTDNLLRPLDTTTVVLTKKNLDNQQKIYSKMLETDSSNMLVWQGILNTSYRAQKWRDFRKAEENVKRIFDSNMSNLFSKTREFGIVTGYRTGDEICRVSVKTLCTDRAVLETHAFTIATTLWQSSGCTSISLYIQTGPGSGLLVTAQKSLPAYDKNTFLKNAILTFIQ